MRHLYAALIASVLILSACNGNIPPTIFVMEVTREVVVTVVVTASADTATPLANAATPSATPSAEPTASSSSTPTPSPTPDPRPTPVIGQIYVAEQVFERGRMFWLQPAKQIWVLSSDSSGKAVWSVYADSFVEGMAELDPMLTPPAGLLQPMRGFGKLWRENANVRAALGWAKQPEIGYQTRYEYHAGGSVNAQGQFVQASGYHVLETLEGVQFRFTEGVWTWEQMTP
jgi:hypothetical protein